MSDLLENLPGEEFIRPGLADFEAGRVTVPACLIAIGFPRLQRAGLFGQDVHAPEVEAELTLYKLLQQEGGNAYARYNSLIRRLVSFERALERRQRQKAEDGQRREEDGKVKSRNWES